MTTEAVTFPPPPRFTGDPKGDSRAMADWLWTFFNAAITERGLVQTGDFAERLEDYPLLNAIGQITAIVANRLIYTTSDTEVALTTLSPFMRTLLDDADQATAQSTLGIAAVLSDAELLAIAGLTSAADKLPYFTGSGTAALADITSLARTLLDDATESAMRSTLGASAGVWPVAQGGTGASTAATARTNLGVTTGTCTLGAAASTVVSEAAVTAGSIIFLFPTNAAAGTLVGSAKSPYISAKSAGVSFTVTTADGAAAAGTETFNYLVIG